MSEQPQTIYASSQGNMDLRRRFSSRGTDANVALRSAYRAVGGSDGYRLKKKSQLVLKRVDTVLIPC